jgi:hypothetical protein
VAGFTGICRNRPQNWNIDFIKYEWGHLLSKNQNETESENIHNLALYSARCNQHIQSSMDIQELMIYGGILAQRISSVLLNRRKLFESDEWKSIINQINQYK